MRRVWQLEAKRYTSKASGELVRRPSALSKELSKRRNTEGATRTACVVAWLDLGLVDYESAYQLQLALHRARVAGSIPDVAMVLEHPPCITLGRSAQEEHLLVSREELRRAGLEVYATDRGGDVTYHGPGQLVLYTVFDLSQRGKDVHAHVWRLEEVVIQALAKLGVEAGRRSGYPGVWTAQGKIAALGLRVRRWVAFHGIALNVSPNLAHFGLIVPCGLHEEQVTSLSCLLGRGIEMELVKELVKESLGAVFWVDLRAVGEQELASWSAAWGQAARTPYEHEQCLDGASSLEGRR